MAGLDTRVPNEDESTKLEVVVLDGMLVVLDELCDGLVPGFLDLLSDPLEVLPLSLELLGSEGEQIGHSFGVMDRSEVGSFGKVEREHRVYPISDVVLSRRIVYSIYYNSTLLLPIGLDEGRSY